MKQWLRALLWISSFMFLARIAVFAVDGAQALQGDTVRLAAQNAALRACWSAQQFHGCPGSGYFPLYQHLIAFPLGYAGAHASTIVRFLAIVSFLAFVKMLVLGASSLSKELRPLWVVLILVSPLLHYAQSSFGEALAACLILTAVAACFSNLRLPWIAASVALAGLTKEPAPVFLVVLGSIATYVKGGSFKGPLLEQLKRLPKPRMIAILAGAALAVFLNASFNIARFGVPWNPILFGPTQPPVPLTERPGFFLGIWLSPNAGLLFFWPAFVAFLVALGFAIRKNKLTFFAILATLGLLTAGFASWWAPFGWICWGPRLFLPWIPTCILILLRAYPTESQALLEGRSQNARRAILGLLVLTGLTQFSVLFGGGMVSDIFAPAPGCPVTPPAPDQDPLHYFYCMRTYVWDPRISYWRLLLTGLKPPGTLFSLAYIASIWTWGLKASGRFLRRGEV